MNGFINILKVPGLSSNNILSKLKRSNIGIDKIGHAGTLDPAAAGVLPVCIGTATKLADYIMAEKKDYRFEITFGLETDSLDADGKTVLRSDNIPDKKALKAVLLKYTGNINQIPPMFSAIQKNGQRLYRLARKGEFIDIPPRNVYIHRFEQVHWTSSRSVLLHVICSKGTYVRALCRDICRDLNTCGYVSFLLRTRSGFFEIEKSKTVEEIVDLFKTGDYSYVVPIDEPIGYLQRVDIDESKWKLITNGNFVEIEKINLPDKYPIRIYCKNEFIGIGSINKRDKSYIKIDKMLYKI